MHNIALSSKHSTFKLLLVGLVVLSALFCTTVVSAQRKPKDAPKPPASQPATEATPDEQTEEQAGPGIEELYFDASIRQAQEVYDEAVELYKEVLKIDPTVSAATYNIGLIYYTQARFVEALPYAQKALKADENNFWYYELLAQTYEHTNQLADAIKVIEKALARFPEQIEAKFQMAEYYILSGSYEKALALYDELEQLTGQVQDIGLQKHRIYVQTGKREAAVAELRRLLERYPESERLYQTLYETFTLYGDTAAAVTVLEEQLLRDPGNTYATFTLSDRLIDEDLMQEAGALLTRAFQNRSIQLDAKLHYLQVLFGRAGNPAIRVLTEQLSSLLASEYPDNQAVRAFLGRSQAITSSPEEQRSFLKQTIQDNKLDQDAWADLLDADKALNRYDLLLEDALSAMEIFPNVARFNLDYATAAFYRYDYPVAARYLDRFLLIGTSDNALLLEAETLLGQALQFLREPTQSDEHFEAAFKITPYDALANARKAYVLVLRGERLDEAQKSADRALRDLPKDAEVLRAHGLVLYSQGKFNDAQLALQQSYSINPDARTANHLGDAFAQLGNIEQATYYWNEAKAKGLPDDRLDQKIRTGKL